MLDFRFVLFWLRREVGKRLASCFVRLTRSLEAARFVCLMPLALPAFGQPPPTQAGAAEDLRNAQLAFERAQPAQARTLLNRYLAERPEDTQALLAAGEIDFACFRDELAQQRLEHALQTAPGEARVLRACARVARTPAEEFKLLARYVAEGAKSNRENPSDLEDALSHIRLHQAIGNVEPWSVESPQSQYRIKMVPLLAGNGMRIGYGLPVSINGAKPLQLLVDSGADNILISERRARQLHLKYFSEGRIISVSGRDTTATRLAIAETVSVGNLVFHNAVVQVSPHEATADQDGLIGLSVFSHFLVGFDLRHGKHELALESLPGERATDLDQQAVDVVRLKHLLLVRTGLGARMEGYFILDTGSVYSAIDSHWAERIPAAHLFEQPVEMKTATGFLAVRRWSMGPGALEVAGRPLLGAEVISLDLNRFSNNHGFRVGGLIGSSSLAGSLVTVNYRDGTVDITRP